MSAQLSFVLSVLFIFVLYLSQSVDSQATFTKIGLDKQENGLEFIFILAARQRECFYQYLQQGAKFKLSYRVLTPKTAMADNTISMDVRGPSHNYLISSYLTESFESPFSEVTDEGDYAICFNNYAGRFTEKKTQVFLGVIVPYVDEGLENEVELNGTARFYQDMAERVHVMFGSVFHVEFFLRFARVLEKGDLAAMEYNKVYIDRISMGMIVLICAVAYLQTYMLKRLFRVKNTTPTHKPRA